MSSAIEICNVDNDELAQLAKKTFVLISIVGPYGLYGEPAFKACAENGTHYVDVNGEPPFTRNMIRKYEAAAKASGALMFPQSGIESAPADIAAAEVARVIREQLQAKTGDVTAAVRFKALPSGGTLLTALTAFDTFSLSELRSSMAPYALSPIPRPNGHRGHPPLLSYLTGGMYVKHLGRVMTAMTGTTDAALVERTWGLLESMPSRSAEAYGPNFSFMEYSSARDWLQGAKAHWMLVITGFLIATLPPLRWLAKRHIYAPGTGPSREVAQKDIFRYRAVGIPDVEGKPSKVAYTSADYKGGIYHCELWSSFLFTPLVSSPALSASSTLFSTFF